MRIIKTLLKIILGLLLFIGFLGLKSHSKYKRQTAEETEKCSMMLNESKNVDALEKDKIMDMYYKQCTFAQSIIVSFSSKLEKARKKRSMH